MQFLKLVIRNTFRQRLRTTLTIFGMSVAILAFCLLDTIQGAWYTGVNSASPNRLVSRNSVSLIFPLPLNYRPRIQMVPGVERVVFANWFGGVYIDEHNFFPRIAVGPEDYFDVASEFLIPQDELKAFWKQRNACIAGRKIVERYGWKPGDTITLTGNIYPGEWRFVLRGVYSGATKSTDETLFLFRWDYLDETLKRNMPSRAGQVGWYLIQIRNPADAAQISEAVDDLFKNSSAETLTETEKAFQAGFVAMTEAIVIAVRIVSYVVIAVILIVLVNTMAMTSRERTPEYAILKTMGFRSKHLVFLIMGESVFISMLGSAAGLALSYPAASVFSSRTGSLLPIFQVNFFKLLVFCAFISFGIGIVSALLPVWSAGRLRIADALRHLG
ncbi:MAG TPA: FtsX-like permease family protein [Syntrophobacteraceae bacterium]|nr:FtsX-like permease family protein [Syntrophobacteraceae bacterium]